MSNSFISLRQILSPSQPLQVGSVISINGDGTSTISLPGGNAITVRGESVQVGAHAFIQAGEIRGPAPSLDSVTLIVY